MLINCPRLTHLSLTGVQEFLRDDLLSFCREAPPGMIFPLLATKIHKIPPANSLQRIQRASARSVLCLLGTRRCPPSQSSSTQLPQPAGLGRRRVIHIRLPAPPDPPSAGSSNLRSLDSTPLSAEPSTRPSDAHYIHVGTTYRLPCSASLTRRATSASTRCQS